MRERYNADAPGMYPQLANKLNETLPISQPTKTLPVSPPTSATQDQTSRTSQGFFGGGSRNTSPHPSTTTRTSSILFGSK